MRGLAYAALVSLGLLLGWSASVMVGPLPMFDGPRVALHSWLYGDPPQAPAESIDTVSPSPTSVYASPAPGTPSARRTRPRIPGAAPARTSPPGSRDGDVAPAAPLLPRLRPPPAPVIRPPPTSAARVRATGGPEKDQTTDAPTTSAAPTTTTETPPPTTTDPPTSSATPSATSGADTLEPTTSEVKQRCQTPRHRRCSRHW